MSTSIWRKSMATIVSPLRSGGRRSRRQSALDPRRCFARGTAVRSLLGGRPSATAPGVPSPWHYRVAAAPTVSEPVTNDLCRVLASDGAELGHGGRPTVSERLERRDRLRLRRRLGRYRRRFERIAFLVLPAHRSRAAVLLVPAPPAYRGALLAQQADQPASAGIGNSSASADCTSLRAGDVVRAVQSTRAIARRTLHPAG